MIASFLYETSALDPLIYAAVIVVLLGVTLLAILTPARRAARVDPMAALARSVATLSPQLELVGVTGFEPTTPASRTQCSTRLSYTPTCRE